MNMDIDVDDDFEVSKHQVLESNAGYYVGTLYFDSEIGGWLPNSRVSDYFKTKTEAEIHLDYLQKIWDRQRQYYNEWVNRRK